MVISITTATTYPGNLGRAEARCQPPRQNVAPLFAGYQESCSIKSLSNSSDHIRETLVTSDQGISFKVRQFFSSLNEARNLSNQKGSVIFYLPGLGNQSDSDEPFFEHQVDGFQVYSLCRPYVPVSGKVEFAKDHVLKTTLEAIQWLSEKHGQPISVVGFSLGGLTALQAAAQKPSQVQRLCLISPTLLSDAALKKALVQLPHQMNMSEDSVRQLRGFCRGWKDLFKAINVPVLVQSGKSELTTSHELFLRALLKQAFLPDIQHRLEIFPSEDHEISKIRLEKLRNAWINH